jgi:hypothetical protein
MDKSKEDVLSTDVVVIEHAGFLLCEDDDSTSPVGKAFEHQLLLINLEP